MQNYGSWSHSAGIGAGLTRRPRLLLWRWAIAAKTSRPDAALPSLTTILR